MKSITYKVTSINLAPIYNSSRRFDSTAAEELTLLTPENSVKSIFVTNVSDTYDIKFYLSVGQTKISPVTLLERNETFILESTLYLTDQNLKLKVDEFQIGGTPQSFSSTYSELNFLDVYISYD